MGDLSESQVALVVLALFGVSVLVVLAVDWKWGRLLPKQVGPPNLRARRALAKHLDRWPTDLIEGVVRWHDYAALTKHDVRELLHERGWFYRGQDMDADGWPLFATRDPQLAESTEPPPSRHTLLVNELQAVTTEGQESVLIDLTPYQVLTEEEIDEAAEGAGWEWAEKLAGGTAPRGIFTRTGS